MDDARVRGTIVGLWVMTVAALGLTGCAGDPLEGEWEGDGAGGERDTLTIDSDLTGDAELHGSVNGAVVACRFGVVAAPSGADRAYTVDFHGAGACSGTMTLDCSLATDEEELDCEGAVFTRLP